MLIKLAFCFEGRCFPSKKARLAQSVEHETLNLRVVGSSPTLGVVGFEAVSKPTGATAAKELGPMQHVLSTLQPLTSMTW